VKNLVISTPPTWDGTPRKTEVDSLKPLGSLSSLDRLLLLGVRPKDLDLSPIMKMTHLKEVDIGGVPEFTIAHYAKLAAALPHAKGRCLKPYFEIKGECPAAELLFVSFWARQHLQHEITVMRKNGSLTLKESHGWSRRDWCQEPCSLPPS
jgi:hypothetical protein